MPQLALQHVAPMPGQVFRFRSPVWPLSSGPGLGRRQRHRPGESRRDWRGPGGEFAGGLVDDGAGAGARKQTAVCSSAPGSGLQPGSV
jgi:hypothetical protein